MTIEVTQQVSNIEITVTQSNNEIKLQPVVSRDSNGSGFDGIVNGGTP